MQRTRILSLWQRRIREVRTPLICLRNYVKEKVLSPLSALSFTNVLPVSEAIWIGAKVRMNKALPWQRRNTTALHVTSATCETSGIFHVKERKTAVAERRISETVHAPLSRSSGEARDNSPGEFLLSRHAQLYRDCSAIRPLINDQCDHSRVDLARRNFIPVRAPREA